MALLAVPSRRFTSERLGISFIFLLSGLSFATWAGRLSIINEVFGFTGTGFGAFLACMTAGSLLGLGLAPALLRLVSPKRLLLYLPLGLALCLVVLGLAISITQTPGPAFAILFLNGVFFGCLDVAMNVYGAGVERQLGRSIMPSLHGFFSLGTLLGAGIATLTLLLHWRSFWHFGAVAVVLALLALLAVRMIRLRAPEAHSAPPPQLLATPHHQRHLLLLLGLMVAGLSFAEGAANDWLAVASVAGHGLEHESGALMFTIFVLAMTVGRFCGGRIVDVLGAVRALILMGLIALAGVGLFIVGQSIATIGTGALLWGLGSSLGFPVGMSIAASRTEKLGPRAVSIISTFGYGAMLSGPPIIGLFADHSSVLQALWLIAVVLTISILITPRAGQINKGQR